MTTVQKIQSSVQKLQQEYIPKAKARRFRLGVQVFGLQEFSSLNAIGRKLSSNRWSGESRIRRLVKDIALTEQIQHILVQEVSSSHFLQHLVRTFSSWFGANYERSGVSRWAHS